jgi:tetratricopeptide (TPR) repeat protein
MVSFDRLCGWKPVWLLEWLLAFMAVLTDLYAAPRQQETLQKAAAARVTRDQQAIDAAQRLNLTPAEIGHLWAEIASDQQDLGRFDRAEDAYHRALQLFEKDRFLQKDYAVTLNNLGTLYTMTGRLKESLSCRKQVLALFQKLGDPLQLALAESYMVDAYLVLGKNKEARQHALLADRELSKLSNVTNEERASALMSYAFASCLTGHCDEGLIAAHRAMSLVRSSFSIDSFEVGQAHVTAGYIEWKTKDSRAAEEDLREGIRILQLNLPPSHLLLLQALEIYRLYLEDAHREAEARQIAEQEKQAKPGMVPCGSCTVSIYGLQGK